MDKLLKSDRFIIFILNTSSTELLYGELQCSPFPGLSTVEGGSCKTPTFSSGFSTFSLVSSTFKRTLWLGALVLECGTAFFQCRNAGLSVEAMKSFIQLVVVHVVHGIIYGVLGDSSATPTCAAMCSLGTRPRGGRFSLAGF